jgi:fumarate hydratase class I
MEFKYEKNVQIKTDHTEYNKLSSDFVTLKKFEDKEVLCVKKEALSLLAEQAFTEISFKLRTAHLEQVAAILKDPESSENDRFVALNLLENSAIAIDGDLPTCQDTGTAIVFAKKGQGVWTEGDDSEELSRGIFNTYQNRNLRYSQMVPIDMFEEKNSASNLPAQIDIYAEKGNEYHFLFVAKGGGSANKTYLYQQTKSLLNEESLISFVREKVKSLGTAACPPYHLAFVVGGTSAELNLKLVKLASCGYLDHLPTTGSMGGRLFRDLEWEERITKICQDTGIGAQFGGKYFVHDVRVIRAPRHAASCPVGLGVSCSADRNIKAKITAEGLFVEKMEDNPARFLTEVGDLDMKPPVQIDLDQPMAKILAELSKYPIKTRLSLSGTVIVARDIAHAKLYELVKAGGGLPDYFKNHPVYYAGPAKTPKGMPTGSFGPTTANRMDLYVDEFQALGGSMVMIAKGNRTPEVTEACKKHGGFYLGSIGGPAAILAKNNILSVELVDFEELGMEAVRKITVRDFPAFIICDDKGNDFFSDLT